MSGKKLTFKSFVVYGCGGLLASFLMPAFSEGQVTVEQALKLTPVQARDVEVSVPSAKEIGDCSISAPKDKSLSGWIVKDPAGRLLRRFLDTNGDQDIDLWCYYRDGFEVYRDIDSNFDRKADQYRWFGSQGTRWGVDDDQDGRIDSWKRISAEEVSEQVSRAISTQDSSIFSRLLISADELKQVGFAKDKVELLTKEIGKTRSSFSTLLRNNKALSKAQWMHFGGLRPGLIPEGTDGATQDIVIYENVAALIRSGSKNQQISLGTMIQVGDCWRLIDAPEIVDEDSSSSFASWYRSIESETSGGNANQPIDAGYQSLLENFQKLDKQLTATNSAAAKKKIYGELATTISQLAIQSDAEEDSLNWTRQFADTVTAAIQTGEFPGGLKSLAEFIDELKENKKSTEAIALVTYRYINADFGAKLGDSKNDVAESQAEWLDQLRKFTSDYPDDSNVPDAMMQLAMADEFDGEKEKAEKWYSTISTKFSKSPYAEKAKGAIRRLNSIGEKMTLGGTTLNGKRLDVGDYRGKVVLIHYWADWCDICKEEFVQLNKLRAKYPDLRLIGVNCDNDLATARASSAKTKVSWPQLHSKGGYNSGFAAEMGIVSLPSMILIDKNGQIISTTISANSLERELKSILK